MRSPRRKKHVAEIKSPTKGVATYRTATGAFVFHAHWSADPWKNDAWADMVASESPGGRLSPEFLQEMEADDEAKSGERVYWAFSRERNVIPWRVIPKDWPVHLGADFGQRNATAIIFFAQDPQTKRIYVWDSIYTTKCLDPAIKELVYQKLAAHFDVPMKQLMLEGASRYIKTAVGDKTAASFIAFYQMEPWPVNFAGGPDMPKDVHRNRSTEAKFNRALWPSITCCGVRHMAEKVADTDDEPVDEKKCPLCGKAQEAFPVLYILEGMAPELAEQLEDLVDKEPVYEGHEAPEKSHAGVPNHAVDGAKYLIRTLNWEDAAGPSENESRRMAHETLESKPAYARTFQDSMELMAMRAFAAQQAAEEKQHSPGRKVSISRFGSGRGILFGNQAPRQMVKN